MKPTGFYQKAIVDLADKNDVILRQRLIAVALYRMTAANRRYAKFEHFYKKYEAVVDSRGILLISTNRGLTIVLQLSLQDAHEYMLGGGNERI